MEVKNPVWTVVAALMLLTSAPMVMSAIDCTTVLSLISACSTFVTYGSPDPLPGSPCCDAITSLNGLSDSTENKQSVCRCLMGLITTYNPNATAIATLPGFCGVSLGFTIAPNTDCELRGFNMMETSQSLYDRSVCLGLQKIEESTEVTSASKKSG